MSFLGKSQHGYLRLALHPPAPALRQIGLREIQQDIKQEHYRVLIAIALMRYDPI